MFIMNRIKVVLVEKGIKQKWLVEKLGKSLIPSTVMFKIDNNPVWKC